MHAVAVIFHAIAIIIHVGIQAHVEESRGTVGHIERSAITPRCPHIVRHRIADDTVQIVIILCIGQPADFVGAPATVGFEADVPETLEEFLPAGFHIMGVSVFQTGGIARRITVVAIPAEGADLVFIRVRHTHRIVEFPIVHRFRAIGQMEGRTHIEEIQGAVVGKRHVTLIVVANTVAAQAQACA